MSENQCASLIMESSGASCITNRISCCSFHLWGAHSLLIKLLQSHSLMQFGKKRILDSLKHKPFKQHFWLGVNESSIRAGNGEERCLESFCSSVIDFQQERRCFQVLGSHSSFFSIHLQQALFNKHLFLNAPAPSFMCL